MNNVGWATFVDAELIARGQLQEAATLETKSAWRSAMLALCHTFSADAPLLSWNELKARHWTLEDALTRPEAEPNNEIRRAYWKTIEAVLTAYEKDLLGCQRRVVEGDCRPGRRYRTTLN